MFKKVVEAKSQQRLSGSDRKKLKRTIISRFCNVSDAVIDVLLPPKAEITIAKFQNRIHVYGVEGEFPLFFDIDGRGKDIFPTVYALWKVPELLPAFILKGGEVSRYIIGGADLMFPGISLPPEGLPSFLAGEPWAVKVPGNPAPIAVGVTTMSSNEADKAGLRGKALRITHFYGDSLWASVEGHYVPNEGFLQDVVFEDPSVLSSCESNHGEGNSSASGDQQNGTANEDAGQSVNPVDSHFEVNSAVTREGKFTNIVVEEITVEIGNLDVTNKIVGGESNVEEHTMSVEDVDSLLDKCLLQALHVTVKDKDLPMAGSIFWSNHVLPCRPSGIILDIKKSSYKKLSKWLQAKSSTKLISIKEDKFKKEAVLTVVNRKHPDYTSFRPEKKQVELIDQTIQPPVSEVRSNKLLEVTEVYKSSVHVNPIFASVGADTGKFYSASEATEIVFMYIEKENLVMPAAKSIVVLDAILCDALFKGLIKKGSSYPTEIHKKDLGSAFVNRMLAHHVVTRGSESVIRKGGLKTVQIMTERRQGNKKMTKVSGLESFLIDCEALASELQKKFACSTSVAELPGKKGHEVLVQGGVIDDLAKHLIEQYGIPKRYIEVLDKTRK